MALSLEEAGVPTVAVHTNVFARLAKATALSRGMPTARQAYLPQPVVGVSPAELRNYIHGPDKVSNRPFVQEIVEGLTRQLDQTDVQGATFERSTPRFLEPDTEENLHELFVRNRWTDMLPIILPTEERVAKMLKGTSHAANKVVGRLRPTAFREYWEFDVEKVAVNAVMAGARPEYFPVILAMAASGQTARSSSTNSFVTISVINGPIRNEIGMDSGIGVMGPYNHANATIGRAYGLLSQNLQGGSVPGESYMGTMGNWYAYTACLPEAEERSPWEPFHVQQGFKPTDSTVSIFFGGWYTHAGQGPRDTWQSLLVRTLTAVDHYLPPFLVMDPVAARDFQKLGFSKQKLIDWCAENARIPARDYWDNQWIQTLMHPLAVSGVEPYASKLKAKPDELVTLFQPEDINIIVAGGETQGFWKIFGGRYGGRGPGAPVTDKGKAASPSVLIDPWR